jgi:hypothetical protein
MLRVVHEAHDSILVYPGQLKNFNRIATSLIIMKSPGPQVLQHL